MSSATSRAPGARSHLATAAAVLAALTLTAAAPPGPAALGIGDRLFPTLGNPGYDVRAYDLALRYSGDNTRALSARTRIDARVTAARLDRVNLDFSRGTVRSVTVNGRPAGHVGADEDLVVTPRTPLRRGERLRIEVAHTSPTRGAGRGGWIRTADGLAMANQADAAHRVFPCNDHPSDKALFTFRLTAPRALTAVANGLRTGRVHNGDTTTWSYRTAHPMATELAQVSFGDSAVVRRPGPHGLPLRDVVPRRLRAELEPWLARTPRQITWMEKQVGPYPFETYGLLVADAATGFELETQTLSLFERRLLTSTGLPDWYKESIMVHELAHQWFGDSVTPRRWSDLWLNEGHATWYEWLYAAHRGGAALQERARLAYALSDSWRRTYGPPAAPRAGRDGSASGIFTKSAYDGSALVLYALRQKIGTAAFVRLERAWAAEHRDGTASTADFTALVNRQTGRDLTGFLRAWLHGSSTPPMPGHPDWRPRKSG
jgi:aminopeptidase N